MKKLLYIIGEGKIKGIIFLFCFLPLISVHAQDGNLISNGDMENEGWSAVPRSTDLTVSFEDGSGIGGTKALKAVTGDMGSDSYYILRGEEMFHLDQFEQISLSFYAKSSVSNLRLQAWIQEGDNLEWMNIGDAVLGSDYKKFSFNTIVSTRTSDSYKIKFRGYGTGTVWIDKLIISPAEFAGIPKSDIYEISVDRTDSIQALTVFENACPEYSPGYQGMDPKDAKPLRLFAGRTINWAKLSVDKPTTVQVIVTNTAKVPVIGKQVRILPSRYGITPEVNGNIISFTITEPAQYYVEIGEEGYKNGLIIFADPPETDIPDINNPEFLVLDEAGIADVTDIPQTYSGLYFTKGIHDIGIFHIPHHIKNVYFEDGSWVYGTLIMDGNPGVRIYGRGVLSSARLNYRTSHCVEAINGSNNITLEGLVVADPKYFAVRLIGQYNKVEYTKVIGGWVYNCDGIAAYKGSEVRKCFIWANDDAIKVYRDSITWSDIVVWVLENGGVIQTSWGGAVGGSTSKGVKISRIDVLNAEWDNPGFASALLSCVGNRYETPGKSDELVNWLIEDVVTENPVPLIFKITPDTYSHTHIHGMTLKNWNVQMPMNTAYVNEIKGEDPNDFLSGFVFDSVIFNHELLTNINYISKGDMESGGWEGEPGTTNQVVVMAEGAGADGSTALKSVVTSLGSEGEYFIKCNESFKIGQPEEVSINFLAKANINGTEIIPGIEGRSTGNWEAFESININQDWTRYSAKAIIIPDSSDIFTLKFLATGLNTVIYLDDVKIGPPGWLHQTGMETRYLETPLFLPEYVNPVTGIPSEKKIFTPGVLYPNPVSDILNIPSEKSDVKFEIYSINGSIVLRGKGQAIDVSGLESGLYLLIDNQGQKMKFIKQ